MDYPKIHSVVVIDDEKDARDSMCDVIEGFSYKPVPLEGRFDSVFKLVDRAKTVAQAAVCDYNLSIGGFAGFTGAEVIDSLYRDQFPAVLVTRYNKAAITEMRPFRRRIPMMLSLDETDVIVNGFIRCIEEFNNKFDPSRKPWRTLASIEFIDEVSAYPMFDVILPGWNSNEIIKLPLILVPEEFRARIKPGTRFHAKVNIGAESQDDLYFDEFEFD